ncbi:PLP-dependent transferase [candidate division KSB1 bacterium]|nr:PLP-dependent transferase [candidate division KSB1 bacterium]
MSDKSHNQNGFKFATKAIHAAQGPEEITGAVTYPIFQTSTFAYLEPGKHKGYDYSRTANPTRKVLEENLAALENGKFGFAFASGMAAITTLMLLLKKGDHVISTHNLYGGTYRLFENVMKKFGLDFTFVDTSEIGNVTGALRDSTKMIFVETPTNPMLNLTDIKAISEISKKQNIMHVVDNTFMSPYFQRPLELGADITLHSTTKYLNGHADVIGGAAVVNDENLAERIGFLQNAAGGVPSPFDCWLILRSVKTLAVRMRQHEENALAIANFLENRKEVEKVYYPGLPAHPHYELAKKQMSGFGGMLSAELGAFEKAKKFAANLRVFILAESLGGVESLLCHPVSMTHAVVPKDERLEFGMTDGLVRFSVGIEDIDDLLEDIGQALDNM